jgi:hypothetical protein
LWRRSLYREVLIVFLWRVRSQLTSPTLYRYTTSFLASSLCERTLQNTPIHASTRNNFMIISNSNTKGLHCHVQ